MHCGDLELSRALAVRAIEGGLLRLKWLAAATRFELALLRHDRALKYRPDQPRVPAGNPDGGQWTDGGQGGPSRQSSGGKNRQNGTTSTTELSADNRRENKMVRDIVVRLGLNKDQAQQLHREISGQGLGYHDILQIAVDMFQK
jgi:hypothetical protein